MKINFRSRFLAIQIVLFTAGWNNGALGSPASDALFNQGVGLLNAKRYGESVVCLTKVAQENPKNALAHCYLGLAFVHLGKLSEARQEFFASYCLDPDGKTGKYAQAALSAFSSDAGNTKPIDVKALEQDENSKKTLSVIHEQAQREKNRKASTADSMVSGVAAKTEAQVSRIQSSSAQTLGVSPYAGLSDNQSRYQSSAQPGSPMAQAEESIRIARMAGQQKSAEYRSWSNAQEKKIEDVARNLESQLKESHVPGQAVLKPQGTGFYVRYYGPTNSQNSLPAVHPGVVRILDPNSTSYRDEELSLDSNKSSMPDKAVKGLILKP
jgi:tetratricopeptide (TPR) repeat protein